MQQLKIYEHAEKLVVEETLDAQFGGSSGLSVLYEYPAGGIVSLNSLEVVCANGIAGVRKTGRIPCNWSVTLCGTTEGFGIIVRTFGRAVWEVLSST